MAVYSVKYYNIAEHYYYTLGGARLSQCETKFNNYLQAVNLLI